MNYGNSPEGVYVSVGRRSHHLRYGDGGHAEGDLLIGVESIVGSPGDDSIVVADEPGGDPDYFPTTHTAYGEGGNDTIWGFQVDYLAGGAGDDTLILQNGGTARGDDGADTFMITGYYMEAIAEDFDPQEGDRIALGSTFEGVTYDDVQAMLDGSLGGVLDLELLGVEGVRGFLALPGYQISDLVLDDFILWPV